MSYWEKFKSDMPWALKPRAKIVSRPERAASEMIEMNSGVRELFPVLTSLLDDASITPVTLDGAELWLDAWQGEETRRGWVCEPPLVADPSFLPEHAALLTMFGGIRERWNEPKSWLLNLNGALREVDTTEPVWIRDWSWRFEDAGIACPIDVQNYLAFAHEANGNTAMYHRDSGQVLLWARDHAFDHVEVLQGCPEYTLYKLPEGPQCQDS